MKMRLKPIVASLATAGILVGGLAAHQPSRAGILGFFDHKNTNTVTAATTDTATLAPQSATAKLAPMQAPNYRAIVERWGPAVVGVTVEGLRHVGGDEMSGENNNDPFFQFFRGLPGFRFRGPPQGDTPFRGQGSGFIISSDGLILTNAHVVRDAREVTVKLADRRELKAKVLGSDPATDIAVLRVSAEKLPTVQFGDPKSLQVGDYVLAIGAPFGFEQSVTAGIVSAKGRSLPGDAYVPFIQTDAAVNPGNSGGPLFDADGNVVGINAQIYSQTGGYQGLAFAIPIDVALHAKDQIVATGHATHARLGVMVQDLDQSLAESFGLSRPDGALVSSVEPDSAAAKAGLKAGDVITQVGSTPVKRAGDLSSAIGMSAPGTKVAIKVWRDKSTRDMEVALGSAQAEKSDMAADSGQENGRLGLALHPLTRQERAEAEVDHGLIVEDVSESGAAARAGIQPGDVVLGINGQPARSVEQVRSVLAAHPKSLALLIERNGQKIFVPVRLG
jgi:serine protease Do